MQKYLKSLTVAIIIIIGIFVYFQLHQSGKVEEMKTNNYNGFKYVDFTKVMQDKFTENEKSRKSEVKIASLKKEEVEDEIMKRPHIEDASVLSDKDLDYIWEQSIKFDWSYELILAFARVESNFNKDLSSRTQDHGIFQIHSGTDRWIAKQLGLKKFDLTNIKTCTDFAIYYLNYLREQYRGQDMSEEEVFVYNIVSFNRGIKGANRYIAKHGKNVDYLKKIRKYKELYEMEANE